MALRLLNHTNTANSAITSSATCFRLLEINNPNRLGSSCQSILPEDRPLPSFSFSAYRSSPPPTKYCGSPLEILRMCLPKNPWFWL